LRAPAARETDIADAAAILVVENNDAVGATIAMFLEERGYKVLRAHDFATGADIVRAAHPNLLISDVLLPDGNGGALAELAVAMSIPALLISGAPRVIEARQADSIPFLEKPFRMSELESHVQALLCK
jgi:DNA-binding response OmpR family regulator